MSRVLYRAMFAVLLAAVATALRVAVANGSEVQNSVADDELASLANTSIVWVSGKVDVTEVNNVAKKFVAAVNEEIDADQTKATIIAVYDILRVFVLDTDPDIARPVVRPFNSANQDAIDSVTGDVIMFADQAQGCSNKIALPSGGETPLGVRRVGGGTGDFSGATHKRAWIVDSGIDNPSGLVNVQTALQANCVDKSGGQACRVGINADVDDDLGHGTMIAGIIGAEPGPVDGTTKGLWGVAPGAKIVPVKIYATSARIPLSKGPLAALNHIGANAAMGDVVNLSWGSDWVSVLERQTLDTVRNLNTKVHELADTKGLKIVIAAGNTDPNRPSWVQFIAPAGSGAYPAPPAACKVCTVSAVESVETAGAWTDTWWSNSNFGNRPPDFAEPGVNVKSLWPGNNNRNRVRTCSGTSFAAAHLSGIFIRGNPKDAPGDVLNDPDASGTTSLPDPVGICCGP